MRKLPVFFGLALLTAAFADTLTLKSGRVVNGNYMGGTPRQVKMEVGDRVETFDVGDVASLQFTSEAAAQPAPALQSRTAAPEPAPAPAPAPAPPVRREENVLRPDPAQTAAAPRATGSVELPAGTSISVRMIDGVDSEQDRVGKTYQASTDEPVMLNGETVIPRGADVVVKLVDDKESGKLAGRTELTLDLVSVKVNGRMVDINTQSVTRASDSRTGRTEKVVGGTAALGAIIGAIAGGGKGAAVGAASGAGVGAGVQVMTKGQRVRIPSETRLTFQLDTPVKI